MNKENRETPVLHWMRNTRRATIVVTYSVAPMRGQPQGEHDEEFWQAFTRAAEDELRRALGANTRWTEPLNDVAGMVGRAVVSDFDHAAKDWPCIGSCVLLEDEDEFVALGDGWRRASHEEVLAMLEPNGVRDAGMALVNTRDGSTAVFCARLPREDGGPCC